MGSYSWLQMNIRPDSVLGTTSPEQQFQIRFYLDLPFHTELNGALYYVDQIQAQSGMSYVTIPAYVRADLGVVWRPKSYLELGIWGQNLLDNQHPESASYETTVRSEVPRGVVGKVTLHF